MALELVQNGDTGLDARTKINAGIVAADDAVARAGDTMTGTLTAPMVKITNAPAQPEDAANKEYVDAAIAANVGSKTHVGDAPPVDAVPDDIWFCTENGLSYILYADGDSTAWVESNPNYPVATDPTKLSLAGGTMTGDLLLASPQGTNPASAVRKDYVDVLLARIAVLESMLNVGTTAAPTKAKRSAKKED